MSTRTTSCIAWDCWLAFEPRSIMQLRRFGILYPQGVTRPKRLSVLREEVRAHYESEAQFLAGRHSRLSELVRFLRIGVEFFRGLRALYPVGPAVTVFGSARFHEGSPFYDLARQVGRLLAHEGFTVMTGGGPGLMEAANRGAKEAGGYSVGCNIILPHEQEPNKYLDKVV